MKRYNRKYKLTPEDWGLQVGDSGEMRIEGFCCTSLAKQCGTPLHVVSEKGLERTANRFNTTFRENYPGKVSVHYAFKCNPVPGIIKLIKASGVGAEVMSPFELYMARELGFNGHDIIVNGPLKTDEFLYDCLYNDVRFIVVDSLDELFRINKIASKQQRVADILLRVNPDIIPKGMNRGTATGSRKGCALGLDLKGGEADRAIIESINLRNIHVHGFHFHIGSGIRDPRDYKKALIRMKDLVQRALDLGFHVDVIDIGGGFASPFSREMTTTEMLYYQATERLPVVRSNILDHTFSDYISAITSGIERIFGGEVWPELIAEPGRCIISPNQFLLLTIHQVKERKGIKKWITTDGGIGTVAMPAYYEFHEVFLCNDINRQPLERVTINGPGCFAADVIYKNKWLPEVKEGEVIAVMDSGAYFTSWESNFGHPRPAIISVGNGRYAFMRKRETFEEMVSRDVMVDEACKYIGNASLLK